MNNFIYSINSCLCLFKYDGNFKKKKINLNLNSNQISKYIIYIKIIIILLNIII